MFARARRIQARSIASGRARMRSFLNQESTRLSFTSLFPLSMRPVKPLKQPLAFFPSRAPSFACLVTMRGNRVTMTENNTRGDEQGSKEKRIGQFQKEIGRGRAAGSSPQRVKKLPNGTAHRRAMSGGTDGVPLHGHGCRRPCLPVRRAS